MNLLQMKIQTTENCAKVRYDGAADWISASNPYSKPSFSGVLVERHDLTWANSAYAGA